ncbi:DMT family transporter [Bradyrhizobium sp. LHD-71]|uniref:DMT family transporter n=1 Tax=Bradyrhizobium sp. LHD-71 TaxID=3072141 RepID=UPI00280D1223|nr:DMT family transporter [Bradyrhizobium sp. LHD-71]MDQ8729995.1 DMT family transporter [Bradyrhizobium sp. LHD-71]
MSRSVSIDSSSWWRLVALAVLWSGVFFFVEVALRELPPFTIVCARIVLGALVLVPVLNWFGMRLPRTIGDWIPLAGMGLLNNVVPMSLIVIGQTTVSSGLASVLNATTPFFTTLVLAAAGDEQLTARRLLGVLCGIAGVAVLQVPDMIGGAASSTGVLLCLGAAFSYGLSGLWARRRLSGVPPLMAATGQLVASAVVTALIASVIERPWTLPMPGPTTWLALLGLGILSTAVAYILFFQIIARSGPSNVMLVTLLVPAPAILLGRSVLGESLEAHQIAGAAIIAAALVIIDGRLANWMEGRWRTV